MKSNKPLKRTSLSSLNGVLAKIKCQLLEIDERMELQNRFVQLVPESNSAIVNKGKQLLEYEKGQKSFLLK